MKFIRTPYVLALTSIVLMMLACDFRWEQPPQLWEIEENQLEQLLLRN